MQRSIETHLDAPPSVVYEHLRVLDGYPAWLEIVRSAEPAAPEPDDVGPAWWVTLRARVGPFARSKRLRMVLTEAAEPTTLVFERSENDGRDHARWRLEIDIEAAGAGSFARVDLSYAGGLWSPVLDVVLGSEIDGALDRLRRTVENRR